MSETSNEPFIREPGYLYIVTDKEKANHKPQQPSDEYWSVALKRWKIVAWADGFGSNDIYRRKIEPSKEDAGGWLPISKTVNDRPCACEWGFVNFDNQWEQGVTDGTQVIPGCATHYRPWTPSPPPPKPQPEDAQDKAWNEVAPIIYDSTSFRAVFNSGWNAAMLQRQEEVK